VTRTEFVGIVETGRGRGASRMDERVLAVLRERLGVTVVAGTLNVRLPHALDPSLLPSYLAAADLGPGWEADTGQAGYRFAPALIAGRFRGVVAQAHEPGYPDDLVELLCEAHLRAALGLGDGDPIRFTVPQPR
jgi:CTP-dependent riboflavin kinase